MFGVNFLSIKRAVFPVFHHQEGVQKDMIVCLVGNITKQGNIFIEHFTANLL